MSQHHVRIASGAVFRRSTLELDGHDVADQCRGFTLKANVDEFTTLALDLATLGPTEYDGEAQVRVSPETEQLLISLGWTPPAS